MLINCWFVFWPYSRWLTKFREYKLSWWREISAKLSDFHANFDQYFVFLINISRVTSKVGIRGYKFSRVALKMRFRGYKRQKNSFVSNTYQIVYVNSLKWFIKVLVMKWSIRRVKAISDAFANAKKLKFIPAKVYTNKVFCWEEQDPAAD